MKKSLCFLLTFIILVSAFVIAPITASAYDLNKPQNFRAIDYGTEDDNSWVTVAWDPVPGSYRYSYQLVWSTTPSTDWKSDSGNTEWWINNLEDSGEYKHKIKGLTYGTTYYIFVRWVANEYTKHEKLTDLGDVGDGLPDLVIKSDCAMIKFDWSLTSSTDTAKTTSKSASKSVSVKVKAKSVKASALKKSNKTIKPLTIKNAKKVKVVKVKKGTTKKIYNKIKVAKKTGAITFKKGKYKKGTYKIRLKIKADSKTFNKTVKVKIK